MKWELVGKRGVLLRVNWILIFGQKSTKLVERAEREKGEAGAGTLKRWGEDEIPEGQANSEKK